MKTTLALPLAGALLLGASAAHAVTSSRSVPSAFGGNGHNVSFDGRLFIVRDGGGWKAQLLRPEAATYHGDGLPNAEGLFSPKATLIAGNSITENALAICEPDPNHAPFACDEAGNASASGPYDCYDVQILDSDALTPPDQGGHVMRRRSLKLWVKNPKSANAEVHKFAWGAVEPLATKLMGIEPTVTADGKLLVYQGHPDNDGKIDILVYTTNDTACGLGGWSTPRSISRMAIDPAIAGVYPLGERKFRSADGEVFEPWHLVRGAYPWITAEGDAITFTAANMPCVSENVPAGCGPRRNALSVIGYPTNWAIAHIDGGVNPSTTDTVRLFFSSPGPATFPTLPTTAGEDVWPFFGSNTHNYVEITFDDGLDGQYAGFWHFNENIDHEGELDRGRTPDVSGYFNTGALQGGLGFADANDGVVGKALFFDGVDDRVEAADSVSLNPVNGITMEMWVHPTADPNCSGGDNARLLLNKGAAYGIAMRDDRSLVAWIDIAGTTVEVDGPTLDLNTWRHVSFEYDGATGAAGWWVDEQEWSTTDLTPGTLAGGTAPLMIGGPGARPACPETGDGAFAGGLDEVAVSRFARHLGQSEPPPTTTTTTATTSTGAGTTTSTGGNTETTTGATSGGSTGTGGSGGAAADPSNEASGGCAVTGEGDGRTWLVLLGLAFAWMRRRR